MSEIMSNDIAKTEKKIKTLWEGVIRLPIDIDKKIDLTLRKEISAQLMTNTTNVITLVNGFMQKFFQNFYNIPVGIRMICKIIEREARKRYDRLNKHDTFYMISQFLFDCWVLPQFKLPDEVVKLIKLITIKNRMIL